MAWDRLRAAQCANRIERAEAERVGGFTVDGDGRMVLTNVIRRTRDGIDEAWRCHVHGWQSDFLPLGEPQQSCPACAVLPELRKGQARFAAWTGRG